MKFTINENLSSNDLVYYEGKKKFRLNVQTVINAIKSANSDIAKQYADMNNGTYVAPLLRNIPLKNLSGAVGECFGEHLCLLLGNIKKNPHEASAPDFIPIVPSSKKWFSNPTTEYYPYGGFDTKASFTKDKKFTSASASSHHNQTSTVLVVQWTMNSKNVPEIIGVFYTNKLTKKDWRISTGKVGSKTTNAAALTAKGMDKLRSGWIVIRNDVKIPTQRKLREQYGL